MVPVLLDTGQIYFGGVSAQEPPTSFKCFSQNSLWSVLSLPATCMRVRARAQKVHTFAPGTYARPCRNTQHKIIKSRQLTAGRHGRFRTRYCSYGLLLLQEAAAASVKVHARARHAPRRGEGSLWLLLRGEKPLLS